jgi:hypothetical protein
MKIRDKWTAAAVASLFLCVSAEVAAAQATPIEFRAADKPEPILLGADQTRNIYVTAARTKLFLEGATGDQGSTAALQEFGQLYRRVSSKAGDGQWNEVNAASAPNNRASISCTKKSSNPLAQFIGAVFGYKENTTSVLTVTIQASGAGPNEAKGLIKDFPLFAVERKGKDKCEATLNTVDLTSLIKPNATDRLFMSFKVKRTKNRSVDLSNVLGLIGDIASLTSQNATDGVADGVAEIAASGINGRINKFFERWDTDVTLNRQMMLPLFADANLRYDKIVLSFGAPSNASTYQALAFRNGPAIAVELEYTPSVFATNCVGLSLSKTCVFQDDAEVVESKSVAGGKSIADYVRADPKPDDPAINSLFDRFSTMKAKPTPGERAAALNGICQDMKKPAMFPPVGRLNTIDQLVLRYAVLKTEAPEYFANRKVAEAAPACFAPEEESKLGGLNTQRFGFSSKAPLTASASAEKVAFELKKREIEAKKALFGAKGKLDIQLPPLVEGEGGADLRAPSTEGESAAAVLNALRFSGGQECAIAGYDPETRRDSDTQIGFLLAGRDTVQGAIVKTDTYLPIIVSRAKADGVALDKMTIAKDWESFYKILNRKAPDDPDNQKCVTDIFSRKDKPAIALFTAIAM